MTNFEVEVRELSFENRRVQNLNAFQVQETDKNINVQSVVSLQHCTVPNLTASDVFRDVMFQLDELHISIKRGILGYDSDDLYSMAAMRTFPAHLVSDWLAPASEKLKALSIYDEENWGPLPGYFDASSLSFPNLRSLALGFYTLAYDGDINWILRMRSLCRLILHNCMIASWIAIAEDDKSLWDPPMDGWTHITDYQENGLVELYSYNGTWAQAFDRIAASLPNLIDFRFDMGVTWWFAIQCMPAGRHRYGFAHRDSTGTIIHPLRYTYIDRSPFPWNNERDDGDLEAWLISHAAVSENKDVTQMKGDQTSLDILMEVLRARK
ncbi:hypothetical protein E8E13_007240 [Curvularia kusanoi]|uniref:Uncharacterized protein n=1 Tax=Curvularia kusanoi TaxID=90978 RepID=A0A9P4W9V1_CURKU|nr:hypothetical protein E8E13_007240 [Curvularia kusanoi]